jgi:hypothetical protein
MADKVVDRIPEWRLQEHCVVRLNAVLEERPGAFTFAAGLEGVHLRPRQREAMRAQGMTAGEPDLRFYLDRGRLMLIELKADAGTVSRVQKDRHALLRALGFVVHVVRAKTPEEAWAAVWAHLEPVLT